MKFALYRDRNKEWRWRLLAANGRILANSGEGYKRKSTMVRSIWSIQKRAGTSLIA